MSSTSSTGGVGFAGALFSWRICARLRPRPARFHVVLLCHAASRQQTLVAQSARLAANRTDRPVQPPCDLRGGSCRPQPNELTDFLVGPALMMAIQRVESGLI